MVNVFNYYKVVSSDEELWQFLEQLPFTAIIEECPSWPALIEIFNLGGEITHHYTEVADLEGATRKYYIDEDPEYSVLMDVAYDMMFTQSMIVDSNKGE